jgi:hypothetical protein
MALTISIMNTIEVRDDSIGLLYQKVGCALTFVGSPPLHCDGTYAPTILASHFLKL